MKEITGDLLMRAFAGDFDVIVHGANCFHTMGAGIAKDVARLWPAAYSADTSTPRGDQSKLGTYSVAHVENRWANKLAIVNAYTQYEPNPPVDYEAIRTVFETIATDFAGQRIAYPAIGSGLAGGNWSTIRDIINIALEGQDHTLVWWDPYWGHSDRVHYRHALKAARDALDICRDALIEVEITPPPGWHLDAGNGMISTADLIEYINLILWKDRYH